VGKGNIVGALSAWDKEDAGGHLRRRSVNAMDIEAAGQTESMYPSVQHNEGAICIKRLWRVVCTQVFSITKELFA
jgi:hypothetical protein